MFAFRTPPPLSRAIHGIIQLYGAELSVQPEYKSDSDISSACLTQVSQKTKAKHDSESCWPKKKSHGGCRGRGASEGTESVEGEK